MIVDFIKKEFPNNNIKDIQIFDFNDRTEDFVTNKQVDKVIKKYIPGMRRTQVSKLYK